MKLPIWVHQVQTSYVQSALGTDDSKLPASMIYGKVADGLYFMSRWDSHPRAVHGIADVIKREKEHQAQGRGWVPWVVARGSEGGAPTVQSTYCVREAKLAAEIAKAGAGPAEFAELIVDLEPYYHGGATPQFWRRDLMGYPEAMARLWVKTYFENGGQVLHLSVDARKGGGYDHLKTVDFAEWRKAIAKYGAEGEGLHHIMPQVYWTDFKQEPGTAIARMESVLYSYGVEADEIAPVFPGDAKGEDMVYAIGLAHDLNMQMPSVWQRLNLSAETATAIRELKDPWAPVLAQPQPDPAEAFRAGYRSGFNGAKLALATYSKALNVPETIYVPEAWRPR